MILIIENIENELRKKFAINEQLIYIHIMNLG